MKIRMFRSSFIALCFSLLVMSSCKKDDTATPEAVHTRGELASYQLISSVTAASLQAGLAFAQPAAVVAQINFKYNISLYKVRYYTADPMGKIVLVSGLMVVPTNATAASPLLAYFHGTSLSKTDVPSAQNTESYLGDIMATEGYVSILPDYIGLGEGTGMHPYIHAESEATCGVDMILVCKQLCSTLKINLSNQLFLCGYSQGGHVTMAVQKMIEEKYASQLTITASAPMAGPYDVSGTQKAAMLSQARYPAPVYLPLMLYSYQSAYNLYTDMSSIFSGNYATLIPSYFSATGFNDLTGLAAQMPASGIPADILTPTAYQSILNDPTNALNLNLKKNDLYDWTPKSPMKLCHCDGDVHVPMANSTKAVESFKAKGVTVELVNPLSGGTHITCVIPSFLYVKQWFNTLKN